MTIASPSPAERTLPPQETCDGWSGDHLLAAEEELTLVAATQDGNHSAFERLVRAYQDRVYNLSFRMLGDHEEAADVTQEAFIKAFRAVSSFRRDARFSTWIYRIAVNACLSRHRQFAVRRRHAPHSLDAPLRGSEHPPEPADHRCEPAQQTSRNELADVVQAAIAALSVEFRTVVLLRDIEGYSYEEIGEILGCPIGTVRSRLHRARAELGRRLKSHID
jgi:RNA polymerase sigma-70 factor (ECF subfamily)